MSDLTNNFGYAEMYEWAEIPNETYGRFVQFEHNDKITYAKDKNNVIGVSTICTTNISDNPNHWKSENIANEYGDVRVHKKIIVEGHKVYDDKDEFNYIKTSTKEKYVPNKSPVYDESMVYVKRTNRKSWVPVTLIGKCIVKDYGGCIPGEYCTVYNGDDVEKFGTAIPSKTGWRVLSRYSKDTIMILYK